MTESEWLTCTDPTALLDFLHGKGSDRKLRLFAAACCRTVWEMLPDQTTRNAVEIGELAADGEADPRKLEELLQRLGPRLNREYGIFLCGGCEGPGSIYAAMAAMATLNDDLTYTWYMGQTASETHTAWECVARARAQTAREEAVARRWQEWSESAPEGEDDPEDDWREQTSDAGHAAWDKEYAAACANHCDLLRDIFGPLPFRSMSFDPLWLTPIVKDLATRIYQGQSFDHLPVLGDALEEAGCTNTDMLTHCRQPGKHVRGCWVLDLVLTRK